jgi:hypothetical protein
MKDIYIWLSDRELKNKFNIRTMADPVSRNIKTAGNCRKTGIFIFLRNLFYNFAPFYSYYFALILFEKGTI